MSEPTASPVAPTTAGGLLRQARQAQGLHIAALAASIKVAQRKLELLESDQFDQLPDATFTRALAQTVCRALKIDPAPVLGLLPPPSGYRLEHVGEGINAPFRDRPDRMTPREWGLLASPGVWIAAVLVIGAAVLYLLPAHWLSERLSFARPASSAGGDTPAAPASENAATMPSRNNPAEAADAASAPEPVPDASLAAGAGDAAVAAPSDGAASLPIGERGGATALAPEPAASGQSAALIQLRPSGQSWVEVTDSRGQLLISRTLASGEAVGLDGQAPFKLRIGNAGGTELTFRGRPVNLAPYTRDNVARLELK